MERDLHLLDKVEREFRLLDKVEQKLLLLDKEVHWQLMNLEDIPCLDPLCPAEQRTAIQLMQDSQAVFQSWVDMPLDHPEDSNRSGIPVVAGTVAEGQEAWAGIPADRIAERLDSVHLLED